MGPGFVTVSVQLQPQVALGISVMFTNKSKLMGNVWKHVIVWYPSGIVLGSCFVVSGFFL